MWLNAARIQIDVVPDLGRFGDTTTDLSTVDTGRGTSRSFDTLLCRSSVTITDNTKQERLV